MRSSFFHQCRKYQESEFFILSFNWIFPFYILIFANKYIMMYIFLGIPVHSAQALICTGLLILKYICSIGGVSVCLCLCLCVCARMCAFEFYKNALYCSLY
jgi:hypothetical protein